MSVQDEESGEKNLMATQIIKCRDDTKPVSLEDSRSSTPESRSFRLSKSSPCTWAKPADSIGTEKLRPRIEPWLTALVQSEHLSLLVGSGLTHAVHGLAEKEPLPGMDSITFTGNLNDTIKAEVQRAAIAAGRKNGNIEDQIRVATDLLRGLEIIASGKAENAPEREQVSALRAQLTTALQSFAHAILKGEQALVSATAEKHEQAFTYLVSFLMSFASRSGTRERLQLFTTNYDRFIEAGADAAGLRLIDRFVGTLAPVFRASRLDVDLHYNPPGIRGEPRYLEGVARFTKLHGSVDWLDCDGAIRRIGLPFGATDTAPYSFRTWAERNRCRTPHDLPQRRQGPGDGLLPLCRVVSRFRRVAL